MKKQTGMWIDGSKAVIITLVDGKEQIERVEAEIENRVHHFAEGNPGVRMGDRHLVPEKRFHERERHQLEQYLEAVLKKVNSADELYVFGPAETRVALQRKLDTDKSYKALASRLRAVEPADNMTKNQIVARVKEFYRSH
jgi:hypothetical protein